MGTSAIAWNPRRSPLKSNHSADWMYTIYIDACMSDYDVGDVDVEEDVDHIQHELRCDACIYDDTDRLMMMMMILIPHGTYI